MTAMQAIETSVLRSITVEIQWTKSAFDELLSYCDDHTETVHHHEFWGRDEDGTEWRVNLLKAAP